MPPFTQHIFVCGNQRAPGNPRGCCNPDGGDRLRNALKGSVKECNLGPTVRVNGAGCLDQCEKGPVLVIYPAGIWYGGVQLSDVPRIVEQTICQGRILSELVIPPETLNTR